MTSRPSPDPGPILLFGKTGQVGAELGRALAHLGTVVAVGRERVDFRDRDGLRKCVREVSPSIIVNAAAYTDVDGAESEPDLAMAINGEAPGVLAEEARSLGVPLVHYSTDYVFGRRDQAGEPQPYREEDPTAPLNHYGRSKLAGEEAIRSVGPRHLILRTSWVFASSGKNFLMTIRRLAAEREVLRIVNDQVGSPTWARAIAEATARILEHGWPHPPALRPEASGLYHLSASGATSWFGFASAIVSAEVAAGRMSPTRVVPIPTSEYPLPASRPSYSVLDNGLIEAKLRIELPSWSEQLAACLM